LQQIRLEVFLFRQLSVSRSNLSPELLLRK
jgi:hypothetical protein